VLQSEHTRRDADKVEYLMTQFRSGGLAIAGVVDTLTALENGQVDELIVPASTSALDAPEEALAVTAEPVVATEGQDLQTRAMLIADALVTKAQQTSAKISFIEDSQLLASIGGCGALLRYRI